MKFFIKGKFDEIDKIINSNEFQIKDYNSIIVYFLCLLNKRTISDIQCLKIIHLFIKKGVNKIDLSLFKNEKGDKNKTYEYIKLNLDKKINEDKLELIFYHINSSRGKIKNTFKLCNTLDDYIYFIKNEILPYILSFKDKFVDLLYLEVPNNKLWQIENTLEIFNRLELIVNYFGLYFLIFLNIKIFEINEFDSFKYYKKVQYYKEVINRLYFCFVTILDNILENKKINEKLENILNKFNL